MKQTSLFKQFFLLVLLLVGSVTGAWADDIWVKTNFSDLKTGDIVVIVDQTTATAMSNNNGTSNPPTATAVSLNDDKSEITGTVADNIQWTVTKTEGGLRFGVGTKYLYCTNTNNGVRVGTNTNNVFSWKFNDDSSENFLFNNATSRYLGVYDSSNWRCYTSVNNNIKETVTAIYKKTSAVDVSSIALSGTYTTEFVEGSEFNHDGVVVTATYSDESQEDVTAQATFSEPDMSQVGAQTITVTYNGKTATYDITITAAPTYTITYYVRGKEYSVNRKQNVELNLDTPENINEYMKFLGWSESEDVSGTPVFVANNTPVTTDMTLYAIFGKGNSTYNKVTSTDDITDGEYLIVNEETGVAFDGSLETLDATNDVIYVTINEGVIEATDAANAATFTYNTTANTLKSASGYYIGRTAYSNGLDSNKSTEYKNTITIDNDGNAVITASGNCILRYNKASDQNRFRYYKNGQQDIQLYKKVAGEVEYSLGENEEICVTSAEWATATTPDYAVDFTGDAKVYIATNVDSNIKLEQITDAPAGTAIVVNAPAGSYTMKKKATATTNVEENKLVSSNSVTAKEGDYALGYYSDGVTIGFGKLDATGATKMTDGKAFIPASTLSKTTDFLPFIINEENSETTSINSIENSELRIENYDYFNLSGQRVGKDYKGIVVVNGKKVIRK